MTFLAALRVEGITAPCAFDGPINGASFPNALLLISVISVRLWFRLTPENYARSQNLRPWYSKWLG